MTLTPAQRAKLHAIGDGKPADPTFTTRAELEWWARCQLDDFMKHAPHSRNQVQLMLSIADRIRRVTIAHLHLPDAGHEREEQRI